MLADEPPTCPGAVTDKVDPASNGCDGVFREFQAKAGNESLDPLERIQALSAAHAKDDEIIDVAAVAPGFELTLGKLVQRIQINQRVGLTQQVADWNAHRLAILGKEHHHLDKALVLDLALYLGA